ncbi:YicS family protein [Pantoea sp.]|uniref:YicS family protein n=1 Tax=Pantoea sp. TaxID=69393 RepID=UPI0031D05057
MKQLLLISMLLIALNAVASPYDNLAYALNEQVLVKDLRAQCDIPATVSDEKVKSVFINSEVNHNQLSAAATALKAGKKDQYQQILNTIRCPDFSQQ